MFLATSMPIREGEIVARQSSTRLFVTANRGANGIDGTIASAVGFCDGLGLPVTLLIGDMASLHDLNSLALLREARHPVIMVVLNNDGGGIFSMLPVASIPQYFEKFFATPHGCDFRNAAEMFSLKYYNPSSLKDFATVYRHSMKSKKSALIEVHCSRDDNARQHQLLWEAVRDKIETQT
jgi:2-succinyl-5-enolpyruvyl-6-hydroxy-3-cyclohexene-1-carboxylate synthase